MNDELKAVRNLGAELGAAMAENDRLRGLLRELREITSEYAWDAGLEARVDAALSQQTEQEFTRTVAAEIGPSAYERLLVEPAPAQDERNECRCTSERRLIGEGCRACNLDDDIHQLAFEVGDPAEDASGYWFDMESFNEFVQKLLPVIREPYEDVLRSLACSLGAGGYNALTVDPAVFEQKIRWGIDQLTRPAQTEQQPVAVPEGWKLVPVQPTAEMLAAVTTSTFEPLRQEAMKMAREDYQAMLYAAPIAQTEQQPAYVECRECTDCGHVGINDAHQTDATCAMCDWSGPSPVEDQCPDCGKENVMGAACPKCSGRYRILAETHVAAPIAQTALSAVTAERDRLLEELAATNRGINAKLPRRKFAAVGTGALYAEQNYCYRRGWKEGVAALRAQIRAAAMAAKEA